MGAAFGFEQIDTPQNLYNHPRTPFVARFVGDNNSWSGIIRRRAKNTAEVETDDGRLFSTISDDALSPGTAVELFLRPEAMLIQPDRSISGLNRFEVVVKAILFDGANSRLLAHPLDADTELLIALPQNRQYDTIKENDTVDIGWDYRSGICFPKAAET
jgi:spermidine/putrescine transport system ATP-binding protein